ncbi:MAG TPA: hypothetical protein VFS77_04790, partial [Pyrinomonadaceae bacterium]|nr:hypothetical protein [Pyrinomonadaceae bacterium]
MIHSHRALLAVLLSLALFAATAYAQQSVTKTQDADAAALRAKAFGLLESVAGQLTTLQSGENRARLGANIADSLWKHDENRARELLQLVESDIRSELQRYDPRGADHSTMMVFLKLRVDTLERIAKHDAPAALAFLKATKPNPDLSLPKSVLQNAQNIEIRLAQQVARDNPEAALILARESLDRGFSYDLVPLLRRMNVKHKELAHELFKDIVEKLQGADLGNNWEARILAGNLARGFRPPAMNETSFRELMSVLVSAALKNGCGNKSSHEDSRAEFCAWLASEAPDIEKFDQRAAPLRHWNMNPNSSTYAGVSIDEEFYDLIHEGTKEDIVAFASKHPGYASRVYWQLIERERMAGNIDEARKIATTYITDPERLKIILAQLDHQQKKIEITEAMLVSMEETLEKKVKPFDRAMYLLSVAHRFAPGDRNLAFKLLKRAADIIDTMKPGKEQTRAQLLLAVMYSYEKSDRGLALMESLVPRLNELVDVAARLDGYETNYLRDGEWNMSANGEVGNLLTLLSHFAAPF